ncbi:MAG: hypothetical protein MUP10_00965 [Methanoregulaceae archaeon]|nr:hypothetical protein [Methanoregulaceae archaeon]
MSAIGVLLLVLAGYVLVSGTLASADSIASAQKDVALEKDEQVHTAIQISNADWGHRPGFDFLWFNLKNIGSAPIGDFNRTDMYILLEPDYIPVYYSFNGVVSGGSTGYGALKTWGYMTITPDTTHPYMLDPGETMAVNITYSNFQHLPNYVVNVTTPNGVTNGSQFGF